VRRGLVALEVALALVVAVGAGLLARTFAHLRRVDPGFDAGRTLTLQVALPEIRYSDAQASAFFQRLVEGVAALPGVRHAGVVDCLPLSGCEISGSYYLEERMPAAGSMPPEGDMTFVSPDYFRAMGIPLRQGRLFAAEDRVRGRGTAGAVIVDEDLARRSWPGESPIGKRLKFEKDLPWQTVVGVVGHVQNALDSSSREQVYIPLAEVPLYPVNAAFLVVRTDVPPAALVDPVRELVKGLDAELPIFDVQTISDRLALSLAPRQLSMSLLLSLAILALFLSAVGVYGVIACSVTERVREIGLRMALGARSRDILALVVGEGLVMALGGVAAGLGIACGATKLLGSLLFGVSATDPATYLATSILLVATVVAASYLPARRATRLSPTQAFGGS
jgi:predicted permease